MTQTCSRTTYRTIHYCPNYATTHGHHSIHNSLSDAISLADPSCALELAQTTLDDNVLSFAHDNRPLVVYVDFPDVSHWSAIRMLQDRAPRGSIFVYLSMILDLEWIRRHIAKGSDYAESTAPPDYDYVLSLEPGARRLLGPGSCTSEYACVKPADVLLPPLIRAIDIPERYPRLHLTDDGISEFDIVVTSGFPDERQWLRRLAASARRRGVASYALDELPKLRRQIAWCANPRVRHVLSPAGYSTFWELYLLGVSPGRVGWLRTYRPVEALELRVQLLQPNKMEKMQRSLAYEQRMRIMRQGSANVDAQGITSLALFHNTLIKDNYHVSR